MIKNNFTKRIFSLISLSVIIYFLLGILNVGKIYISINVDSTVDGISQIFYPSQMGEYSEKHSVSVPMHKGNNILYFALPTLPSNLRWDPSNIEGIFSVKFMSIKFGLCSFPIKLDDIKSIYDIETISYEENMLYLKTRENAVDPQVSITLSNNDQSYIEKAFLFYKIFLLSCSIFLSGLIILVYHFKNFIYEFFSRTKLYNFFTKLTPLKTNTYHIILLLVINLITFFGYYFKDYVFYGDFSQSYHQMTYAMVNSTMNGHFPTWEPRGGLGYPLCLSLQDSFLYPPVMLFSLFKIQYTHQYAVYLQCLHLFFGSVGMYFLAQSRGLKSSSCFFAALLFHFSATFYSNAIHVDIIRGAVYAPWLFYCLSPKVILQGWKLVPWIILLLVSFITGSYIGIIVAAIYVLTPYCLYQFFTINRNDRIRYISLLLISGVISSLIITIKFLPAVVMKSELAYGPSGLPAIDPWILASIFFDFYTVEWDDPSMRSLYIPPVILLGLVFLNKKNILFAFDFIIVLFVSFLLLTNFFMPADFISELPGLNLSRFHLSDFRMFFHVSLIFILVSCIDKIVNQDPYKTLIKLILFFISIMTVMFWMYLNKMHVNALYCLLIIFMLFTSILYSIKYEKNSFVFSSTKISYASSVFCVVLSLYYWNTYHYTWKHKGFYESVNKEWNIDFKKFYKERKTHASYLDLDLRPKRQMSAGDLNFSNFGRRAYYFNEFENHTYDGSAKLKRNLEMRHHITNNSKLFEFMALESAWKILPENSHNDITAFELTFVQEKTEISPVIMNSFSNDGSLFTIKSDQSFTLVENELYFPGWQGRLLKEGQPDEEIIRALDGPYGLRAWELPSGYYALETFYRPPWYHFSLFLTFTGLALFIIIIIGNIISRFRNKKIQFII